MRIIAGAYKGRRLATPRGAPTRPTADQVRIALPHPLMPWLPGARVPDPLAGDGRVGPDALPRGAALAACAPRCGAEARPEKLRLLARLATVQIARAPTLERLHESLCFVRAYPDDAAVQDAAERALREFPVRVRRLAPSARARLHDSGIADTDLDYPFGLPMARWLATRFPGDVKIAWRTFDGGERLEEALSLLVTPTEAEAFTE